MDIENTQAFRDLADQMGPEKLFWIEEHVRGLHLLYKGLAANHYRVKHPSASRKRTHRVKGKVYRLDSDINGDQRFCCRPNG